MSLLETRGGVPHVFGATIDSSGRLHSFGQMAKWVQVIAATQPVKVYFNAADFAADTNYVTVPIATVEVPLVIFEGPADIDTIWLRATIAGSSVVTVIAYLRRG